MTESNIQRLLTISITRQRSTSKCTKISMSWKIVS